MVDSALPPALVRSESGGRFTAQNDIPGSGGVGHFGRGQFSRGRLEDAKRAGIIPQGMTPDDFMASPQAQQAVEAWHVGDILNFAREKGLDRYIGQVVGGVPITEESLINIAHLGGNRGLERFLTSGGQYNPSDAFGTSLLDYAAMGSGGTRRPPTTQPQGQNALAGAMGLRQGQQPVNAFRIAPPQLADLRQDPAAFQSAPRNALATMGFDRNTNPFMVA